ncbi:uncharacterized protein DC041_0008257 [Schistosoma bovis]|uniref:Uncharacterized protein n=1 Tax=Schistosoma bovis TaxID=6184 RepID=A0A430QNU6_SCHBO|nr:uncharacterized protein DC041_0008257 [Schistosoma bovis]
MAFSVLVSTSYDNKINVYKEELDDWAVFIQLRACSKSTSWVCIATLTGDHIRTIFDLSWSSDGQLLASCGSDNRLCIYKMPSSGLIHIGGKPCLEEPPILWGYVPNAHSEDVNCVRWQPKGFNSKSHSEDTSDSQLILTTASDDGYIKFWSIKSSDGQLLASCGSDNRLCIYKMPSSGLIHIGGKPCLEEPPILWGYVPNAHSEDVNCVRWQPKGFNSKSHSEDTSDSQLILTTASDDGYIKFWSIKCDG